MSTRWIIELDYTADPDTDYETFFSNLSEELAAAKGAPEHHGDCIVFDELDDAFNVRLRFAENVVNVRKDIEA